MDTPRRLIPPHRLDAEKGIALSKDTRRRLEAAGDFPLRIPISAMRHAYDEREIDAWIEKRIAARETA